MQTIPRPARSATVLIRVCLCTSSALTAVSARWTAPAPCPWLERMEHRLTSRGITTVRRNPIVALATTALLIASGALSSAVTALASTEQAYWTNVTQVTGVAGQSTSVKAVAMTPGGVTLVAGQFRGVATFPTGPSTSVSLTDDSTTIFVAALTPPGSTTTGSPLSRGSAPFRRSRR